MYNPSMSALVIISNEIHPKRNWWFFSGIQQIFFSVVLIVAAFLRVFNLSKSISQLRQ